MAVANFPASSNDRSTVRVHLRPTSESTNSRSLVFDDLGAPRFWLDVKARNTRAKSLYDGESFVVEGKLRDAVKVTDGFDFPGRHVHAAARVAERRSLGLEMRA